MKDQSKTKQVLIQELASLRQRIKELEQSESERKNLEGALRESTEHYRLLFENSPVGIFVYDTRLRFVNCNDRYLTMLRTTRDRIIGLDIAMLKDPIALPVFQLSLEGKCGSYEGPYHTTTSDIVIWISVYTAPLYDGEGRIVGGIGIQEDITERKQAEETLRWTEERYRRLFEEAPLMYVITRNQGGVPIIADCNRAFLSAMKYTCDEVVGRPLTDFYTPESRAALLEGGYRRALGGSFVTEERRLVTCDGRVIETILTALPETDAQGNVTGTRAMYLDITDRKRAEEALRLSEENFRRSLEDSPLGVRIVTIEGETIYANRAILDIYGYDSIEELRTTPAKERYTPESFAEFQVRKEKRKRGDNAPSEYEIRIIGKDAKIRHLQVFRKEILWDGERQFQVIYQDITERKRMEEEKRRMEERSRKVVEDIFRFIPEGVLVFSRKMELLRQNQAFRELVSGYAKRLGFAEDELEKLIVDKIKAAMGDKDIKEIRIARKHETGEQT